MPSGGQIINPRRGRVSTIVERSTITEEEVRRIWNDEDESSDPESEIESRPSIKMDKEVTTHDGAKAKFSDCVYWNNKYFLKGSKYTFIDAVTNQHAHVDTKCAHVIIGINDDKSYKVGFTQYKIQSSKLPIAYDSDNYGFVYVLNEKLAEELGFIEDVERTAWFKKGASKKSWHESNDFHKFNKCRFNETGDKAIDYKFGLSSPTYRLTEGKKYSFGVEFECSYCYMPDYKTSDLNLQCVRDGSLNGGAGGPEFVTGVLKGDYGLIHLQDICYELTKRGEVDKYCGLHLHLGGFNFNKENIVYLFKTCLLLESEIFSMVPKSRRKNTYCRELKDLNLKSDINKQSEKEYKIAINEDFERIFDYVAYQKMEHKSRKENHPMGSKCSYDHKTPRYCWVNFVPTIFNTRGNEQYTMEIRIHSGTTSYNKTKNWLLLWMGVLNFVDNNKEQIKSGLTLEQIIKATYPKNKTKLLEYIKSRKEIFSSDDESKEYVKTKEDKKSIKELCV